MSEKKDILEKYPLTMQVRALPERRYFRTSRFFILLTLMSLSITFALGTFIIYAARHLDISIASPSFVGMFSLHSQEKTLKPMAYIQTAEPAFKLMSEKFLWGFVPIMHKIVTDTKYTDSILSERSSVYSFANQGVTEAFLGRMRTAVAQAREGNFVRDVHILDIQHVSGNLFRIVLDTFDLPPPDPLDPLCDRCSDSSFECLSCKREHALGHERFEIFTRLDMHPRFVSMQNPVGVYFRTYNILYMNVNPSYPKWDLPLVWQTKK